MVKTTTPREEMVIQRIFMSEGSSFDIAKMIDS